MKFPVSKMVSGGLFENTPDNFFSKKKSTKIGFIWEDIFIYEHLLVDVI